MSQQQKFIQLPLVGTLLLFVLGGVYLMVRKRFSKPGPPIKIRKHSVEKQSDDTLTYWTADKMRNAKPANLPDVTTLKREKQQRRPPV